MIVLVGGDTDEGKELLFRSVRTPTKEDLPWSVSSPTNNRS